MLAVALLFIAVGTIVLLLCLVAEWCERVAADHRASVERGEHDEKCEFDAQGFLLCHCSKRRREAAGFIEPPTDDLYFPPPDCPHCTEDLHHDGDGWSCDKCSLSWESNGSGDSAHFTDTFGDDLAGDAERWRSSQKPVEAADAAA